MIILLGFGAGTVLWAGGVVYFERIFFGGEGEDVGGEGALD